MTKTKKATKSKKQAHPHAIILNSGGPDSRVTAAIAKKMGYKLHSLYIDFNKHNGKGAKPAAARTAKLYCVSHTIAPWDIDWYFPFPDNKYFGYPHTNTFVHLIGSQFALKKEAEIGKKVEWVFTGSRVDACAPDALTKLHDLLKTVTPHQTATFVSPLWNTKGFDDIVNKAKELGVDLKDTWSCNKYPKCGTCMKCTARAKYGL